MMQVYVMCGVWRLTEMKEWRFIVDEEKRGRILILQSTSSLEELKLMVLEDYGIEDSMVDVEFSYLSKDLGVEFPPVIVTNDRQVQNFLTCLSKKNTIPLCVTFKDRVGDRRSVVKFDLNKESCESSDGDDDAKVLHSSADADNATKRRHDSAYVEDDGKEAHDSPVLVDKRKSSKSGHGVVHTDLD
ncbi:hypothetical protein V5N11_034011 [Cardamine amara subsp. amara]|uniref:Uncharacterized protein n=1 Tax=Cardamine amara subsp. amara TaxID=228776 RepID=A0ABD1A1Z4_CARAN